MTSTSLSLLDRLRANPDAPDWRQFAELYEPLIRGWLRRKDVLGSDADDLVQNTMTVVLRRLADFDHNGRTGAFRNWLRTITVHCLQEHWKALQSRPAGVGGSDILHVISQWADPQSELSQQWNREHDLHVMRKLLERMRDEFEPKTWTAFQRFALDGLSAAEVAQELAISPNAVFIAKSRVLARLRQEAAGLLEE